MAVSYKRGTTVRIVRVSVSFCGAESLNSEPSTLSKHFGALLSLEKVDPLGAPQIALDACRVVAEDQGMPVRRDQRACLDKPYALNPQPQTLHPKHSTLDLKP